MTSAQKNWTVLLSTILAAGAVVLTIFDKNGTDEATVVLTLRLTAFSSFLIYLLVFVARPLRQLLDSQLTKALKENRRYFGIALAGSHTVHLMLIVNYVLGPGVPFQTLFIGGVAYSFLYLMLITSFDAPAAAIGPVAWRRLHKAGLYWIGGTFTFTLGNNFIANPDSLVHQIVVAIILAAISVRVIAFLNRERT
jgi:hypothetical protein